MNRPIKFKIWDAENNKMIYPDGYVLSPYWFGVTTEHYLDDSDVCEYPIKSNDLLLMQFTGLLDKNGNEIYEGDIIETGTGKIVIEFREGGFGWISKMDGESFIGFAGHNYFEEILSRFEIIGNIHQNPELLK